MDTFELARKIVDDWWGSEPKEGIYDDLLASIEASLDMLVNKEVITLTGSEW